MHFFPVAHTLSTDQCRASPFQDVPTAFSCAGHQVYLPIHCCQADFLQCHLQTFCLRTRSTATCAFPSKYVRTDLGSCCGGAPDTLYLLPVHAVMTSLPRHRRRMFRFFSASFCRCRILPRETLCNDVMWMDGTLCSACVVRGALAATAKTATVLPQRRRSSVCPSSVGGQQTDGRCALREKRKPETLRWETTYSR